MKATVALGINPKTGEDPFKRIAPDLTEAEKAAVAAELSRPTNEPEIDPKRLRIAEHVADLVAGFTAIEWEAFVMSLGGDAALNLRDCIGKLKPLFDRHKESS